MHLASSPNFLRNVLLADALSCIACGALQVGFTGSLSTLFQLPPALLQATGWFLLAYAAAVGWIALRKPVLRAPVWLLVIGNGAWALACIALLASGAVAPTGLGTVWVLAQAVTVAVLAELQWTALRQQVPAASWA